MTIEGAGEKPGFVPLDMLLKKAPTPHLASNQEYELTLTTGRRMSGASQSGGSFGVLRQFVRRPQSVETCEMCSQKLAENHQHLLDLVSRKLICACNACAILFGNQSQHKYKRVRGEFASYRTSA